MATRTRTAGAAGFSGWAARPRKSATPRKTNERRSSREDDPPCRCVLTYSDESTSVAELMALIAIAKPAPVPRTLIA